MYSAVQKKANSEIVIQNKDSEALSSFEDNRSETLQRQEIQSLADNSPRNDRAYQLKGMADSSSEDNANPASSQEKPNNTGLPDNLKSGIENLSGYSMDDVKVHKNSAKPAELNAHAYAQGTDIHLGAGQEKHLPHEAWHVVQQKQGRVKPTAQMKGKAKINDDAGLEREADMMGAKAMQNSTAQLKSNDSLKVSSPNNTVQRRVALALDDKDTENDMVIFTNLKYALGYAGGPVVDLGKNARFQDMKDKEDLIILEHGNKGKVQEFNAQQIADKLIGNPDTALPHHINNIIFLSCYAGVPEEAKGIDSSLVNGLGKILSQNGYDNAVFGKKGAALTADVIGERVVDPTKDSTYFPIQVELLEKYGFTSAVHNLEDFLLNIQSSLSQLDESNILHKQAISELKEQKKNIEDYILQMGTTKHVEVKTANDILSEHGVDPTSMTLEEKAEKMSDITEAFYIELIQRADSAGALLPEEDQELMYYLND